MLDDLAAKAAEEGREETLEDLFLRLTEGEKPEPIPDAGGL